MFGKIPVLRILGKVAKVPNLVPLLKQLYLRNGRSKSKSDSIFIKTKVRMMFRVRLVFWYFRPFTRQIAFEYRQKRCHFSMVFLISRKISSLIFLETLQNHGGYRLARFCENRMSGKILVQELRAETYPNLGSNLVKNQFFCSFSNFTENLVHWCVYFFV